MEYKKIELKKGINLHTIQTDVFKTNIVSIFLTTKLDANCITKNALISLILRRGTNNIPSQEALSKKTEEMYGAIIDSGLDKTGDNQVFKFYIETINNKFLPQDEQNMWKESVDLLADFVFNPYCENGMFKQEYFEQEKNTLKQLIEGVKDSKASYSLNRCIEEMFKGEPFGIYKYGKIEEIDKIDNKELFDYYKQLINNCKIDIFMSGDMTGEMSINEEEELIKNNCEIKKLDIQNSDFNKINIQKREILPEKFIEEQMEVTQGKLVLGLNVNIEVEHDKNAVMVYNAILGGCATSKMFQNVREKAHLAYVASSSYMKHKNVIFVNVGIDIPNFEKALTLTRKQIDDMKSGDFLAEDLENAKKVIVESIKTMADEQGAQISYYFVQGLSDEKPLTFEEYMEEINKVSKEDVVKIANSISINTIYFLKSL